jgi:hypothetical protein
MARSSPASPAGPPHRRPGARRDRRRPIPVPGRQGPQGLRRRRADHPRQRQDNQRVAPARQEQSAQRRRLHLGLLRPHRHPAPAPTTTAGAMPNTDTPPPSETSSQAYSAASTTASPPESTTTRRPPSPRLGQRPPLPQLDKLTASDVFIASEAQSRSANLRHSPPTFAAPFADTVLTSRFRGSRGGLMACVDPHHRRRHQDGSSGSSSTTLANAGARSGMTAAGSA